MLLFWDIYNRLKRGCIDDVENVPWKIGFCETCKLFKRINLTALKLVFLRNFNLFYYLCSCTSIILKSVLKQSLISLCNLVNPYFQSIYATSINDCMTAYRLHPIFLKTIYFLISHIPYLHIASNFLSCIILSSR